MTQLRLGTLSPVLLLLLAFPAGFAAALTIDVPSDFESIQEAIDAASYGDRISIQPGVYEEALSLRGGISLLGTGLSPDETLLSGGFMHKVASIIGDGAPLHMENLSLVDAYSGNGGAMSIDDGCWVTLHKVWFMGNGCSDDGGALFVRNSHIEMTECFFYANYALGGGGGSVHISIDADRGGLGTQIIRNCTFAGNSGCCGGTSLVMAGGVYEITNNVLEEVTCLLDAEPHFGCNNGEICGFDEGDNFIANPRFCGFEYADCRLESDSPCLPENNPACGLIGAFGACSLTATAESSFSTVKALFR